MFLSPLCCGCPCRFLPWWVPLNGENPPVQSTSEGVVIDGAVEVMSNLVHIGPNDAVRARALVALRNITSWPHLRAVSSTNTSHPSLLCASQSLVLPLPFTTASLRTRRP